MQIRHTAEKAQNVVREFRDDFHKALEQHAQTKTMQSKEEPMMSSPSKDEEKKRRVEEHLTHLNKVREKEQPQRTEKDVYSTQRDKHRKRDQVSSNPQQSLDHESQERLDRLGKIREKQSRKDPERGLERD